MSMDLSSYDVCETITEEDIQAAQPENGGFFSVGKAVCICKKIEGIQILPYSRPACSGVRFLWEVVYATEIQDPKNPKKNIKIDRVTGEQYAGQHIKDDIGLFVSGEPDTRKKRRILIANEFKLIEPGVDFHPKKFLEIEGKLALIDNCQSQKKNETTGKWEDTEYTKIGKLGSSGYKYMPNEIPAPPHVSPDAGINVDIGAEDI